jgi:hypothetical protein
MTGPFAAVSVAGLLAVTWWVLWHQDWIELNFGKRVAAVAGLSAALVMGSAAQFRPADFSKFITRMATEAAAQYQPILDRALKPMLPTTTTTAPSKSP